jgi:hypothetical protein
MMNLGKKESASPRQGKEIKAEKSHPAIKTEVVDNGLPDVTALGFEEGEDFDEETEGLLADQEGTEYYCDAGFRIKQVSDPVILNYTLESLFSIHDEIELGS